MATLAELGFEIERRAILFHKDTTMPDATQLGYTGNPNLAVNGHTSGETLLFNCPSGTRYLDKSIAPYTAWIKVNDVPGGDWVPEGSGSGSLVIINAQFVRVVPAVFSIDSRNARNRYMCVEGIPSNRGGWLCSLTGYISNVSVLLSEVGDCVIHIRSNGNSTDIMTVQVQNTDKLVQSASVAITALDTLQVFVESANGVSHPLVVLELVELS